MPRIVDGDLIIPLSAPVKYRHWAGGQSVWATLIELGAPVETWRNYAAHRPDLLDQGHAARCTGAIGQGSGFVYCVACGSYAETNEGAP